METNTPNHAIQAFLDMFKWFLIVTIILQVITNGIWAGVHFGYFSKSFNGTSMSADMNLESGTQNNNQSITHGKSID